MYPHEIARSWSATKSCRGFTLIEILIVIFIISIVSGVALLTISSNQQKQVEHAANKLKNLITLAENEAMLKNRTLGIGFTPSSYQFFILNSKTTENPWQFMDEKPLSQLTQLNNIVLQVKMENNDLNLDGKPSIILSPSGDVTPFMILLAKPGERASYKVAGFANGEIKLEVFHEE